MPAALRVYASLSLSPDGTRIAAQIDLTDAADVWVVDVARGALTRLTTDTGYDGSPLWSPDGRTVVFASTRSGQWSLNRKAADGTGPIEQIATLDVKSGVAHPTAWTTDGRILVTVDGDIGLVPADGKGEWKPLIQTPATELQAAISPEGGGSRICPTKQVRERSTFSGSPISATGSSFRWEGASCRRGRTMAARYFIFAADRLETSCASRLTRHATAACASARRQKFPIGPFTTRSSRRDITTSPLMAA